MIAGLSLVIAVCALAFAFALWVQLRSQRNLGLFKRRFAVYAFIKNLLGAMTLRREVPESSWKKYQHVTHSVQWLFDEGFARRLETSVAGLIVDYRKCHANGFACAGCSCARNNSEVLCSDVTLQYRSLEALFDPYMRIGQHNPATAGHWLRGVGRGMGRGLERLWKSLTDWIN